MDSIIYLSTLGKQQYQVPTGWCLDEMTDELHEDDNFPFYTLDHFYCRGFKYEHHHKYGPWCFTFADEASETLFWEPCFPACEDMDRKCVRYHEIPMPPEYYLGQKAVTKSLKPCIYWGRFADKKKISNQAKFWSHNYCRTLPMIGRTFHQMPKTPWCFTNNDGYQWEECFQRCHDIATCIESGETTLDYKGNKEISINNRFCTYWSDRNNPFSAKFKSFASESDKKFCRNFGNIATGPFCLIFSNQKDNVTIEPCFDHCEDLKQKPCVGSDKLLQYWGSVRKTRNGLRCQRWDAKKPHNHSLVAVDFNVEELWEISNFCRNPDASLDGPWCFTLDPGVIKEPCFQRCMGAEISATTLEPIVIQVDEPALAVEESAGLAVIWIILIVVLIFFALLLIVDLLIRYYCLSTTALKKDLEHTAQVIENCRPGRDGTPVTQQKVDNWTKLVELNNEYKQRHEHLRNRLD
uniref:Kringle domain-containing protein n=1 Tax=Romanomermis culicivorax TaxID=13658 RepID=A0A915HZT6_ROMCU